MTDGRTHETLDAFVARTDELTARQSSRRSLLEHIVYTPTVKVDRTLDPDSDRYFEQMMALYEELSNRKLDPSRYRNDPTRCRFTRDKGESLPLDVAR